MTNGYLGERYSWIEATHGMRDGLPRFTKLDAELREVVAAFSDDDLAKPVHRPGGFHLPVDMQLDAYLQAMLISAGKASVYLKAMDRPLPPAMRDWIW